MKTPKKASKKKTSNKKSVWKEKLASEMKEYIINVVYLAIFFGVFTWYQRLILAQHHIDYLDYGTSLIEALILGKVVMIGKLMGLGRKGENQPLILTALYKSVIFTIFIALFSLLEHAVRGILSGKGFVEGIVGFTNKDRNELLAKSLIVFLAFIPFFAFKELQRLLGEEKVRQLFFHKF